MPSDEPISGARVLFVDDDPNILESFRRSYRKHLDLETALSGKEGLATLGRDGPFAVVVSDQRMPEMSGIQFLREAAKRHPDTVRLMLTGNADQQTAIDAVNKGRIFRFLTKPTPPAALLSAVQDAIRVYEGRRIERELLEGSLTGSIRVLTEILGQVHPDSFARSDRLRLMARHVVKTFELSQGWRFEMAAMLAQIGCIALDSRILVRIDTGQELGPDERSLYAAHPALGAKLIRQLPRLGPVADMIARQMEPLDDVRLSAALDELTEAELGGHLLRISVEIDRLCMRGRPYKAAVHDLLKQRHEFRGDLLESLLSLDLRPAGTSSRPVPLRELREGMVLAGDVLAKNAALLARAGQSVSDTMLERFRAFAASVGLVEPLLVRSAQTDTEGDPPVPPVPQD